MREWKNKLARFLLVLSALCMAVNLGSVRNVQAAEGLNLYKRVPFYNSQKVGGSIYSLKYNDNTKRYNIYVEKNGKKSVLAKNCISGTIVTNGKYIYYESGSFAQRGSFGYSYKGRKIICMKISTKKVTRITNFRDAGRAHSMMGCDGRYLYIGEQTQYGDGFGNFSVLDLKTKSIKQTNKDSSAVQSVKGKVLVNSVGFPHGGPVYLVNKDGSNLKVICDRAIKVSVKGNYIYYTEATYDWRTRKCRCDLNGNKKKALTAWRGGVAA